MHVKTDPRLASGIGDKLLLRKLARQEGLVLASERKKRAMQFGSHSARMESNEINKNGNNVWSWILDDCASVVLSLYYMQAQPQITVSVTRTCCIFCSATMSAIVRHAVRGRIPVSALRRPFATHATIQEKDCSTITPPYAALEDKLKLVRALLNNRPLTLAEKILYSHLHDPEKNLTQTGGNSNIRGEVYLQLMPQRVAMQDASAQWDPFATFSNLTCYMSGSRMAL